MKSHFSPAIRGLWRIAGIVLLSILAFQAASAAEYLIQPEDVLSVRVAGESSLSQNYTVDSKGNITMDMVGDVPVGGLTNQQADEEITRRLSKYLKLFEVQVSIVGDNSNRVLVYGEVAKPGSVKLRPGSHLLDALAEAGQPTPNADTRRISVIRNGKTETVDLDAALKDATLNPTLNPGDAITVPSKVVNTVQVDGEVRTPGLRPLDGYKTAYAAILSAGPSDNADWSRVILRHRESRLPLVLDLTSVRTGQLKDDLELSPGDQLTITSRFFGTATLRGEVKTPGEKDLSRSMQVSDFIVQQGGGFTEGADPTSVEIIRANEPPRKINLQEIANGQKSSEDPALEIHPGDVVFVPNAEKKVFAIVGAVQKPGSFFAKPNMRLMDAIITAQGTTPTATHKQFILAPSDPQDERLKLRLVKTTSTVRESPRNTTESSAAGQYLMIDAKELFKGDTEQNIPIKAGDRILIPEEAPRGQKRSVLDSTLRLLPLANLLFL